MTLIGKVAFVTGATGGIGEATCKALAASGADVGICCYSKPDAADALKRELEAKGCRAVVVRADVSNKEQVLAAIDTVVKELGPIDILVNNAGKTFAGKIEDLSEEEWDECLAVNLKSVFLCTQAVISGMKSRRRGAIINLSSLAAKMGGINAAACYSASKAAVSCLTIQTAKELLPYGVNANAIAPGIIDTPMQDVYGPERKAASANAVVRGMGSPEDVANAIVFLASEESRYITGEILDVNGGVLMD
jgi:3-oxoacyl-[acyl-carrier protein] reductase